MSFTVYCAALGKTPALLSSATFRLSIRDEFPEKVTQYESISDRKHPQIYQTYANIERTFHEFLVALCLYLVFTGCCRPTVEQSSLV
jgi:hypothetical protein